MNLNPAQQEAVDTTEGPLLIIAGAGSGKTSVLTERIAHIVSNGTMPYNVLAVTFTNKAAAEMRERISKRIGEEKAKDLWMFTFHSMCSKILRTHGKELNFLDGNLNGKFSIYSTNDVKGMIKKVLDSFPNEEYEAEVKNKFGQTKTSKLKNYLISGLKLDSKEHSVQKFAKFISNMKNEMIDYETLVKNIPSNKYIDWNKASILIEKAKKNPYYSAYVEVYKNYQILMQKSNAVDFDDLIMQTINLFLKNDAILQFYQEKFKYIMVDEYQDSNHCQYVLIKLLGLKYKNVAVVGDDAQSIYKFRGADIRNILEFERDYPNCKTILLEENYRCTPVILQAANEVIAHNVHQRQKNLFTSKKSGEKIGFFKGYNDKYEASFIVNEISRLERQGHSLDEIAILYRNNSLSRSIEDAIVKKGLPYIVVGGFKFFDRAEVLDILAYLKFIENTNDQIAFQRIINLPKRGIGKKTVENLTSYIGDDFLSFLKNPEGVKLSKNAKSSLEEFVAIIEKSIQENHSGMKVSKILENLIQSIDYFDYLKSIKDGKSYERISNVKELINAAYEKEQSTEDFYTLQDFLEHAALYSNQDEKTNDDEPKIQLMTLHSSKGLEFPFVFIAGMEEGIFPSMRNGVIEDPEEERRLAYVGITRAKEKLYLTCTETRMMYGNKIENTPSSFFQEFSEELLERIYDYY